MSSKKWFLFHPTHHQNSCSKSWQTNLSPSISRKDFVNCRIGRHQIDFITIFFKDLKNWFPREAQLELVARVFDSIYSWFIYSISSIICIMARVPIDEKTIVFSPLPSGDEVFSSLAAYNNKKTSSFFTTQFSFFFNVFNAGSIVQWTADILILHYSKGHRFYSKANINWKLNKTCYRNCPYKSFFLLLTIKIPWHEVGHKKVDPFRSETAAI